LAKKSLKLSLNEFVWETEDIKGNEKLLLLYLVFRANIKSRQCNPSWETIARDTGMSRSTVARSLTSLETKGYISRKEQKKTTQFSLLFWVSKRDHYSVKMRPIFDMTPDERHCQEDDKLAEKAYLNAVKNKGE